MDLTILYKVLWKPNDVFKEFADKVRVEPFIFLSATVVISLIIKIEQPTLLVVLLGLFQGFFNALLLPGLDALIIFLIARLAFDIKISFLTLLSAFILCGLPFYFSWLTTFFGYPAMYLSLGGLFTSLAEKQPFLFFTLASITPFFIWVVFLWRSALTQILSTSKRQTTVLLSVLILIGLTIGGLYRMFMIMMFNILFRPS